MKLFVTYLIFCSIKVCGYTEMQRVLKIESEIRNMRLVEKAIDEISAELSISQDNYGKIMVSKMEAVNNAIVHGNKLDIRKFVLIEITGENHILKVSIEDDRHTALDKPPLALLLPRPDELPMFGSPAADDAVGIAREVLLHERPDLKAVGADERIILELAEDQFRDGANHEVFKGR